MVKKRIMACLFCIGAIFSLAGCWHEDYYSLDAARYLKSHSDMTESEIREFVNVKDVAPERLVQLAKSKSYHVRVMAAQNKNLPIEYLEKMMEDKKIAVASLCSLNPNFTKAMFEKQTCHKNEDVRGYLADNKRLPIENLIALGRDKSVTVRAHVGKNPRLPEAEIRRLYVEGNPRVKEGIAKNPQAPMDILLALSREESALIRASIAANPSEPEKELRRMFSEKKSTSLKLSKKHIPRSTRRGLSKNPNTPLDILSSFHADIAQGR